MESASFFEIIIAISPAIAITGPIPAFGLRV